MWNIYQVYTCFMSAHLKSRWPSCSRISIGMQHHKDFGLPGSFMMITAHGVPIWHPSGGAGRRAAAAAAASSAEAGTQSTVY